MLRRVCVWVVILLCTVCSLGVLAQEDEPSVRISNGYLEVFLGSWRTVCADGFGQTEASVACRELGFEHVGSLTGESTLRGNPVIFNDPCTGSESSLLDCNPTATFLCPGFFERVRLSCISTGGVIAVSIVVPGVIIACYAICIIACCCCCCYVKKSSTPSSRTTATGHVQPQGQVNTFNLQPTQPTPYLVQNTPGAPYHTFENAPYPSGPQQPPAAYPTGQAPPAPYMSGPQAPPAPHPSTQVQSGGNEKASLFPDAPPPYGENTNQYPSAPPPSAPYPDDQQPPY